jgi:hypothetical protein
MQVLKGMHINLYITLRSFLGQKLEYITVLWNILQLSYN